MAYDDQLTKTRQEDKELDNIREVTGIDPEEEKRMEEDVQSAYSDSSESKEESEKLDEGEGDSDYKYTESKKRLNFQLSRNKGIVGGLIGLAAGLSLAGGVIFTPIFKLESMLARINDRAFAVASSAIQNRMEHLAERYIITRVVGLESCRSTASIDCRVNYAGMGPIGNLFKNWQDAKIEEKMFNNMGFSVETNQHASGGHRYTLTDRMGKKVTFSNATDFGDFKNNLKSGQFTGGSREFGREMNRFLKSETKWYQVMQRKSIRSYLTRKHDVKFWCFWACKKKDTIDLKIADAKMRMKLKFIQKFVSPVSPKYGAIFSCLTEGESIGKCREDVSDIKNQDLDKVDLPDEEIGDYARKLDPGIELDIPESAEFDLPNGKSRSEQKISQYVIEKLVAKIFGSQAAGKAAASAVPIAGWIYAGLTITDMVERVDTYLDDNGLSKIAATIKSAQYIEYYVGMRTVNDEMKSHELALDEVGATMEEFNGAQESKVWQAYNGSSSTASLFGGSVFAQEESSETNGKYLCKNEKPLDKDELVCDDKKLDKTYAIQDIRDNQYVDLAIDQMLGVYRGELIPPAMIPKDSTIIGRFIPDFVSPMFVVRPTLNGINWLLDNTVGFATEKMMALAAWGIPGVKPVMDFFQEKTVAIMEWTFGKLFPLPIEVDSPGREKYDGLEAGGDIVAAEFAKGGKTEEGEDYGLGAPTISDEEAFAIASDYYDQLEYDHQKGSLFYRLADVSNPYSLASATMINAPTDLNSIASKSLNTIASIPSGLAKSLSSLITRPAGAAQSLQKQQLARNVFGVSRSGYMPDDPIFEADPSIYTTEYCDQLSQEREDTKSDNELSGMEEFTAANPCLLENVVIEAGSSIYIDENASNSEDPGQSGPTPNAPVSEDEIETTNIGNIRVHRSIVSQVNSLLAAAQADGITFGGGGYRDSAGQIATRRNNCGTTQYDIYEKPASSCNPPTARPGTSMHERGLAIDFTQGGTTLTRGSSGFTWLMANAERFGLKNLPSEPWHWSTNGN